MTNRKAINHSGSAFDEFLKDERLLEKVEATARKRVTAWARARNVVTERSVVRRSAKP
jgi:hypothetical protein